VNEDDGVVTSQTDLLEEIKQLRVSVDSLPDRITTSMVKAVGREIRYYIFAIFFLYALNWLWNHFWK
jgi:hypothetical protein